MCYSFQKEKERKERKEKKRSLFLNVFFCHYKDVFVKNVLKDF